MTAIKRDGLLQEAERVRKAAERVTDPQSRQELLQLADHWLELANVIPESDPPSRDGKVG